MSAHAARAALRRAMRQTNRRHDLIAVHVEDPHEKELPNVGILALDLDDRIRQLYLGEALLALSRYIAAKAALYDLNVKQKDALAALPAGRYRFHAEAWAPRPQQPTTGTSAPFTP